ncbi:MAG: hypothetical protein NTX29_12365 [Actinobacteria bacterium]|nr:hypothetical protein [Actinomycetota bacterium]
MTRRRVLTAAAALAVLGSLAMPAPASASPSRDRYAIGDSVMLGAKGDLQKSGFAVNATESRQAYKGPSLLRQRGAQLPTNVVVHLGTNGTYPLATCKALVKAAGPDRRVFLVTVHVPRSWEKSNNAAIRRCDEAFPADRVHVVDWDRAASTHPKWLYSDGTHLRPAGSAAFASLLDDAVNGAVADARAAALASAAGTGKAGLQA